MRVHLCTRACVRMLFVNTLYVHARVCTRVHVHTCESMHVCVRACLRVCVLVYWAYRASPVAQTVKNPPAVQET